MRKQNHQSQSLGARRTFLKSTSAHWPPACISAVPAARGRKAEPWLATAGRRPSVPRTTTPPPGRATEATRNGRCSIWSASPATPPSKPWKGTGRSISTFLTARRTTTAPAHHGDVLCLETSPRQRNHGSLLHVLGHHHADAVFRPGADLRGHPSPHAQFRRGRRQAEADQDYQGDVPRPLPGHAGRHGPHRRLRQAEGADRVGRRLPRARRVDARQADAARALACFSFQATKPLPAIEGGMGNYQDREDYERGPRWGITSAPPPSPPGASMPSTAAPGWA